MTRTYVRIYDGGSELGGPESNPVLEDQNLACWPITPPPKGGSARRYYDASRARSHRRDPRRGPGHAHALDHAEGAAPDLCGRPMIAWPIAAARDAGAGKVVVVDGPDARARGRAARGRRGRGPGRAERAPATRCAPRAEHIDPDDDRARAQRRRAADHRGGDRRARRRARASRRRGDDGDHGARRPERLRARRPRRRTAASSASSRPRSRGDATPEELAIREVNTGIYAFDGGALARGARRAHARQRPGRALPARRAAAAARATARRRRARRRRPDARRSASTTASTSPRVRALAQRAHPRATTCATA